MLNAFMVWLAMSGLTPDIAYTATAVATCESGNTVSFGTHSWHARSDTADGGAFQFNDATWELLGKSGTADQASPTNQIHTFIAFWDRGNGSRHWSASAHCWAKWITPTGAPIDTAHYQQFAESYISIAAKFGANH
jgi:hypothetical protein